MLYSHTQSAPLYFVLLVFAAGIFVASLFVGEPVVQAVLLSSGALMLLFGFSFRNLTVTDEETELLICFGPLPLFKRRLQYSELEKVEQARSTIMDGWGIHMSPSGGWVWNLWGFDCVDVWYRQGRKLRIGTDDPLELTRFLKTKLETREQAGQCIDRNFSFEFLPETYAVCRLSPDESLPQWAVQKDAGKQQLLSLSWTPDELSIVCREAMVPDHVESERDWRCFRVAGKLDFSLVGILARITEYLAQEQVSVFAVSTFDTDYLLVKSHQWELAVRTLANAGYTVYPLKDE